MHRQNKAPPAPDLALGLRVQDAVEQLVKELRPAGPIGDTRTKPAISIPSVLKRAAELSVVQEGKFVSYATSEPLKTVRTIKVVLVDKFDSSRRYLCEQLVIQSVESPKEQDDFKVISSHDVLNRHSLLQLLQTLMRRVCMSLAVLLQNSVLNSWLLSPQSVEETECSAELKKRFNLDLEIASEGDKSELDTRLEPVLECRYLLERTEVKIAIVQLKSYFGLREQIRHEMLEQLSRRTSSQGGSSGRPRLLSENYLTELAHNSGEAVLDAKKQNLQESPEDSNTSLELSWSNRSLSRPFLLQESMLEDVGRRKRSIGNYYWTDKLAFGSFQLKPDNELFLGPIKENQDQDEPNSLDGTKLKLDRKLSGFIHRRGHHTSKTLGLASIGDELLRSGHQSKHDMKMDEDEHTVAILKAIESVQQIVRDSMFALRRKDSLDQNSTRVSSESTSVFGPELQSLAKPGNFREDQPTVMVVSLPDTKIVARQTNVQEESAPSTSGRPTELTIGDWLQFHLQATKLQPLLK